MAGATKCYRVTRERQDAAAGWAQAAQALRQRKAVQA